MCDMVFTIQYFDNTEYFSNYKQEVIKLMTDVICIRLAT